MDADSNWGLGQVLCPFLCIVFKAAVSRAWLLLVSFQEALFWRVLGFSLADLGLGFPSGFGVRF